MVAIRMWPGVWSARLSRRGGVVLVSNRNRNASILEGEVAADAGETRPSEQAQSPNGHPRESASDLGPLGIPKNSGCLVKTLWAGFLLLIGFVSIAYILSDKVDIGWGGSEASNDSAVVSTVADPGAASTGSASDAEGSASDSAGPTSGTWDLYWTNAEGNERVGFTLRFMDDEYGTVEFPYDDRAYAGTWDITGDRISFGFARDFDGPDWSVTEWSSFEGTLVNPDLITGNWLRDDWSCAPDDGCSTKPVPAKSDSRLVRQP